MVQNPVYPETDIAAFTPWLQMNITGPLIERVLQQPIDNMNNMLITGIKFSGPPQSYQLFKIGYP